jgi:hypothetical protein
LIPAASPHELPGDGLPGHSPGRPAGYPGRRVGGALPERPLPWRGALLLRSGVRHGAVEGASARHGPPPVGQPRAVGRPGSLHAMGRRGARRTCHGREPWTSFSGCWPLGSGGFCSLDAGSFPSRRRPSRRPVPQRGRRHMRAPAAPMAARTRATHQAGAAGQRRLVVAQWGGAALGAACLMVYVLLTALRRAPALGRAVVSSPHGVPPENRSGR